MTRGFKIKLKEQQIEMEEYFIKKSTKNSTMLSVMGIFFIFAECVYCQINGLNIFNVVSVSIITYVTMAELNEIFVKIPSKKRMLEIDRMELEFLKRGEGQDD